LPVMHEQHPGGVDDENRHGKINFIVRMSHTLARAGPHSSRARPPGRASPSAPLRLARRQPPAISVGRRALREKEVWRADDPAYACARDPARPPAGWGVDGVP
jgi:hypothetical protein